MKNFQNIIKNISSIALAILVLLVVYDAMMRFLFSNGSIAIQELQWHFFDLLIMFGISYALKNDAHVRVDIFYSNFSQKTKAYVDIASYIFFMLPFSILIIYVSYEFVILSFIQNESSANPGGLDYRFIVKAIIPLAFSLLILQVLSLLFDRIKGLKK